MRRREFVMGFCAGSAWWFAARAEQAKTYRIGLLANRPVGEGEERRDHVLVDDVAEIVCRVIEHRSRGTLNIATGEVYSFRDIAERVAAMVKPVVAVRGTPRQGEMPHGGYRPFDIAACHRAFPDFRYTSLADGLKEVRDDRQRKA